MSVTEYASLGPLFAEAINRMDLSHHDFLLGVHRLYTTLVDFGYYEQDEIIWPPHSELLEGDRHNRLKDLGFSSLVIVLLALLPYPRDFKQFEQEVLPGAWPFQYLEGPISNARDPRYSCSTGNPGEIIPAETLPWTGGTFYWLYDTQTKLLAPWDPETDPSFAETVLDWKAPTEYVSIWVSHIRNLDWVPDRHAWGDGKIEEQPPELPPDPDPVDWRHAPEVWYKNRVNSFRARRLIPRSLGWPGPEYQREGCRSALVSFHGRIDEILKASREALDADLAADPDRFWRELDEQGLSLAGGWYPRVELEGAKALTEFLEAAAGNEAQREGGWLHV